LHLARACRARAALDGRDYVVPDDTQALAVPVLARRLIPAAAAQRLMPEQVIADLLRQLPLGNAALTRVDDEEREAC